MTERFTYRKPSRAEAQALVARMTTFHRQLLDCVKLIGALHEDVTLTVKGIHAGADPRAANAAYVRTVFSLVEGALSNMCALLVEGQAVWGWQLTPDETRILWDATPEPTVPRPPGGHATMTERTKQVFKTGRELFGDHCTVDFSGVDFRAFRDSVLVRDRLTHPKRSADLEVTRDELAAADRGRDWFRAGAKLYYEAGQQTLMDILKVLKRP